MNGLELFIPCIVLLDFPYTRAPKQMPTLFSEDGRCALCGLNWARTSGSNPNNPPI
jgi:hypothetical protein